MSITKETQYSEFEIAEMGIKIKGTDSYDPANCIGSCEEAHDVHIITKKCRGIVVKKVVRGTGTGKLKMTLHMPYQMYCNLHGMGIAGLKTGIKAYGVDSVHPNFSVTQLIKNEDAENKYKAYPNCVLESGITRKVVNGAEEVAEIEIEASFMPDENGIGMYEALESELISDSADLSTTWMTAFTPELAKAAKGKIMTEIPDNIVSSVSAETVVKDDSPKKTNAGAEKSTEDKNTSASTSK